MQMGVLKSKYIGFVVHADFEYAYDHVSWDFF